MLCCAIGGAVGHCMLRLLTKHQSLQRKNNGVMMIERLSLRFTSLAMALLLAGCAVGPDYQRPDVDVPNAFKEASLSPEAAKQWKMAQPADALARGRWWVIFNDPILDGLEDQAMRSEEHTSELQSLMRNS